LTFFLNFNKGEEGDEFYIVEEGSLVALKEDSGKIEEVYKYNIGDYFGELALIKNIPRQASVLSKVFLLSKKVYYVFFVRLMVI